MMTATERYEKAWDAFLIHLNHNPKARLCPFLADKHVSYGGMQNWMMEKGYSVLRAKSEIRKRQAEILKNREEATSDSINKLFVPMESPISTPPVMGMPAEDMLCGVNLTFPNGTIATIKKGSAKAVMTLMKLYEKEDMLCLD